MSTSQKLMITVVMAVSSIMCVVFVWLLVGKSTAIAENRCDLTVSLAEPATTDEFVLEDFIPGSSDTYRITVGALTSGNLTATYEAGEVATLAPYLHVIATVNGVGKLDCPFTEFTERIGELSRRIEEKEEVEILITYTMPLDVGSDAADTELKFKLVFTLSH